MQPTNLLLLLLCAVPCFLAGKVTLPLKKIESVKSQLKKEGKWEAFVAQQRGLSIFSRNLPIYDYLEAEYCVSVSVGSPPQEFVALLDTGSDYSWIPSIECGGEKPKTCPSYCTGTYCNFICDEECCKDSNSNTACKYKTKFNKTGSATYFDTYGNFKIDTFLGKVEGDFGYDSWAIGKGNAIAFKVDDYRFGLAKSLGPKFGRMALDGVLGLGRSEYNPTSLVVSALKSHLLDEPIVSLYLKDLGYDPEGAVGGAITFGGIDNNNCGLVIEFLNTTNDKDWAINVESFNLNGKVVKGGATLIDTGTYEIYGPYSEINNFARSIGASYSYSKDAYIVPCNANFKFSVNIGKNTYIIPREHLVRTVGYNNCELSISYHFASDYKWILGAPFAQEYCQIYDFTGRIGFALAE